MSRDVTDGMAYDRRLQQAVADYLARRSRFWDEEVIADLVDRRQLGLHDLRAALRAAGVPEPGAPNR